MRKRPPNPPQPTTPAIPKTEPSDDTAAFRAELNSFIRNILDANPILSRFYADSVIDEHPNSRAAKILRANYQKIVERTSMPSTCAHIKVTGLRCGSPALHGEQYCYFHQRVVRGIRPRPQSRLHPIAILEDEESIQSSLMEVVNALLRNTIDLKRAELILRALHIAVKNARRVKFGQDRANMVRAIPEAIQCGADAPVRLSGEAAARAAATTTTHAGTDAFVGSIDSSGDGRLVRQVEPCGDGRLVRPIASAASVTTTPPATQSDEHITSLLPNDAAYAESAQDPTNSEPELDIPYQAAIPPTNYRELAEERRRQATQELEQIRRERIRTDLMRASQTVANREELDRPATQIPPHDFKQQRVGTDVRVEPAQGRHPEAPRAFTSGAEGSPEQRQRATHRKSTTSHVGSERLPNPARLSQDANSTTRKPPQKAETKLPPQKKARPEKRA